MNNLLTDHPSDEVRAAAILLLDALCQWERNTGRHNVVIIKDSIGCEYRTLDGAPPPDHTTDEELLDAFESLKKQEN